MEGITKDSWEDMDELLCDLEQCNASPPTALGQQRLMHACQRFSALRLVDLFCQRSQCSSTPTLPVSAVPAATTAVTGRPLLAGGLPY